MLVSTTENLLLPGVSWMQYLCMPTHNRLNHHLHYLTLIYGNSTVGSNLYDSG